MIFDLEVGLFDILTCDTCMAIAQANLTGYSQGVYKSDIGGDNRDGNHELVTATLKDDTILVDREKISEIVRNSGVDIQKAGVVELGNNTSKAIWSMIAMDVGIDGFINQKLGYVVLFNRGKLVIINE